MKDKRIPYATKLKHKEISCTLWKYYSIHFSSETSNWFESC